MTTLLLTGVHYVAAHWKAIVPVLPTLIVALTKVGWMPNWLSKLLQVFSLLAHADVGMPLQPKMPFMVHDTCGRESKARFILRPATATALFFGLIVGTACPKPLPGPANPDGGTQTVGQQVVDCLKEGGKAVSAGLLPAVATALASGTWEIELAALVVKFGQAEVACAVQKITEDAFHDVKMAAHDAQAPVRAAHGKAWLEAHKIQFSAPDGGSGG